MTVTTLKRIALITMVINYIGTFIPGAPVCFQWIGRLSAPLFFYCMAWSLTKTSDKKAYFKRLYLCSAAMAALNLILSIVVEKTGIATAVTSNIFATLFAGAFFIEILEYGRTHGKKGKKMLFSYLFWQVSFAALWAALYEIVEVPYAVLNFFSALCGNALTCEGAFLFVVMGTLFYYTKEDRQKLAIGYSILCLVYFLNSSLGIWGRLCMLLGSDILVALMEIMTGLVLWGASFRPNFDVYHMFCNDFQWLMIAALPLLLACNGKRRKEGKAQKYFYYIFYPVQLYLLWVIGVVILA